VTALVRRFGRTGFAALASAAWALPMLAWAGSVDLYRGLWPWLALAVGIVLLAGWLALVAWVRTVEVEPRPSRLDLGAMTASERLWNALLFVSVLGLVGWLNAAATVDWRLLSGALATGRPGPMLFAAAIGLSLPAFAAGAALSWARADRAYRRRS
jgi:hypothetical protein